MIRTTNLSNNGPPTKRDKVLKLKEFHTSLFQKEEVNNPKFIPRMCYAHKGTMVVGFYVREVYGEVDIYTEFCSRDYNPEDPDRHLWKWTYNPHYDSDYEKSEPHPATGDTRYLIPIENLIDVTALHTEQPLKVEEVVVKEEEVVVETQQEIKFEFEELPDAESDIPYNQMSLRDYAAIQWKKPVSQHGWLNNLINQTFKDE